jgi:hypothetical protein
VTDAWPEALAAVETEFGRSVTGSARARLAHVNQIIPVKVKCHIAKKGVNIFSGTGILTDELKKSCTRFRIIVKRTQCTKIKFQNLAH